MKYFTPELYLQYNSIDDDEADRADEAWEASLRNYRDAVDSFRGFMSPRVRLLAAGPSLHDAELLALQADAPLSDPETSPAPMVATISLKAGQQIVHLDYLLWGAVVQSPPPQSWPFSLSRVHWLYDEVDFDGDRSGEKAHCLGLFWHKILWSDGRSIAIPFLDVIMSRFSPDRPEPGLVARARC